LYKRDNKRTKFEQIWKGRLHPDKIQEDPNPGVETACNSETHGAEKKKSGSQHVPPGFNQQGGQTGDHGKEPKKKITMEEKFWYSIERKLPSLMEDTKKKETVARIVGDVLDNWADKKKEKEPIVLS
jgi:hypothetical protein